MCILPGEYILSSSEKSQGESSSSTESGEQLLKEPSLELNNQELVGLAEDSLGLNDTLGLENDFTSDILGGGLLGNTSVEGLLSNDSLSLPDGFSLEEALQLVGLDEDPEEVSNFYFIINNMPFSYNNPNNAKSKNKNKVFKCQRITKEKGDFRNLFSEPDKFMLTDIHSTPSRSLNLLHIIISSLLTLSPATVEYTVL